MTNEWTEVTDRTTAEEVRRIAAAARTDPTEARRLGVSLIAHRLLADHVRVSDHSGTPVASVPSRRDAPDLWSSGAPWGCATVRAEHFLFIADATQLPGGATGDSELGDLGIRSLLHLPVRDHGRSVGAVDVAWGRPVPDWDDRDGPIVRNLARLLLSCS